jgi:hypothetical protein
MITALQRAYFVLACIGLVALLIWWNAAPKLELRPADTEALRRLQARIVEAISAREPVTISIAEFSDDFGEVCLIRDYYDAYAALSARRPDLGLPRSGRPKAVEVDEEHALAFVTNGRAAFAFLPTTALYEPETRCFPAATALIEVTPGRPARSTLEVGRPTMLRLTPG